MISSMIWYWRKYTRKQNSIYSGIAWNNKTSLNIEHSSHQLKIPLNFPPWLEKLFEIYSSQLAKNALKLSTTVGENFEIYLSQVFKNAFKLYTMVGENFEVYLFQVVKDGLKLSAMVRGVQEKFAEHILKKIV